MLRIQRNIGQAPASWEPRTEGGREASSVTVRAASGVAQVQGGQGQSWGAHMRVHLVCVSKSDVLTKAFWLIEIEISLN